MENEIYEQNTDANEPMSRVYALLDGENHIIRLEGEYTLPSDLTDWILIEKGNPCDRLNLAQAHYLDKPIRDDRGICQYTIVDGEVVERTTEEMDADYIEPTEMPTQLDRIEAQVTYTAMMTDTIRVEEGDSDEE